METLALTKKRELAEREKELLKTKKLADELAKETARGQGTKACRSAQGSCQSSGQEEGASGEEEGCCERQGDHDTRQG